MQCVICKTGNTKKDKTTYSIVKNGKVIVVKDVEAEICNNCGEAYFSVETSQYLTQKVNEAINASKEVEVMGV
jgi:YgiT-type zinc finger domain-containing protein